MSIRMMTSEDKAGQPNVTKETYQGHNLFIEEKFKGCVIMKWEHNGYDDSDFYALVWNNETNQPEKIEYATTRGWTYCNGATIDLTSENKAKYQEWLYNEAFASYSNQNVVKAQTPESGKKCLVVKGRKLAKGIEVEVLRKENYQFNKYAKKVTNCLVKYFDKNTGLFNQTWTNQENLQVIGFEQYLMPVNDIIDMANEARNYEGIPSQFRSGGVYMY